MTGHPTVLSLAFSVFSIILITGSRSVEQIVAHGCSYNDCRDAVNGPAERSFRS
jgi:hypothetical protein